MASTSRRLGLHAPTGGDPADAPADLTRLRDQIDQVVLGYAQGTLASRPAAGVEGRQYYATDIGSIYYDTGSDWVPYAWQPGMIQWTATTESPPAGWLLCNGDAVPRTTYAALFSKLGTVHGAGNGSTTFNVPDLRGRAPIGAGPGRGLTGRYVGEVGGEEMHRLVKEEIPAHAHHGRFYYADLGSAGGSGFYVNQPTHADVSNTGYYPTTVEGGGQVHNNMQPFLALSVWIKT